jgi:Asp-tRNA(Asn)/Glu-tRNA(Gln) amidotransferase A subunit family amidase
MCERFRENDRGPCTARDLPVGMSLVAAKNQDAQIIAIAYQVENVLDLNLYPEDFAGPG